MAHMTDVFTKKKRSKVMAAIRSTGNRDTELRLASILRANGITGWRRHQPLPGKPDFIFRRERLAVFVDGCFWHGYPIHGHQPRSNRGYWLPKLHRIKERDKRIRQALHREGWRILRIWEHNLKNAKDVSQRMRKELKLSLRQSLH